MSIFRIKTGDTSPSMRYTLIPATDLTGASATFSARKVSGEVIVSRESAVVEQNNPGIVRYDWSAGDIAESGDFLAEFEITYSDGSVETFPNTEYIRMRVISDIA